MEKDVRYYNRFLGNYGKFWCENCNGFEVIGKLSSVKSYRGRIIFIINAFIPVFDCFKPLTKEEINALNFKNY